jgi:hypothetical protein
MLKQSWACLGYLCAPIMEEMREEHRRRVLGEPIRVHEAVAELILATSVWLTTVSAGIG